MEARPTPSGIKTVGCMTGSPEHCDAAGAGRAPKTPAPPGETSAVANAEGSPAHRLDDNGKPA